MAEEGARMGLGERFIRTASGARIMCKFSKAFFPFFFQFVCGSCGVWQLGLAGIAKLNEEKRPRQSSVPPLDDAVNDTA